MQFNKVGQARRKSIIESEKRELKRLKENYSEDLIDRVYELNLPFTPCEKPEFRKIVLAIINNDLDYKGTEKNLLEEYKRKAKAKRQIESF